MGQQKSIKYVKLVFARKNVACKKIDYIFKNILTRFSGPIIIDTNINIAEIANMTNQILMFHLKTLIPSSV